MNYQAQVAPTAFDPFRQSGPSRFYFCPGCATPQTAPMHGGQVMCPSCRAPSVLPERSTTVVSGGSPGFPDNDPGRLQMLRMQATRPREISLLLAGLLGGPEVQLGREREAIAIWQSLRARSAQGDVAAGEDLSTLTTLLAQHAPLEKVPSFLEALSESALDASILPRHQSEHLGRLARAAARAGDREGANRYLSWMVANAPELEADTQFRATSAVLATFEHDMHRVIALLGPQANAIPLAATMSAMATVFRANALEMLGNAAAAVHVLGELPSPSLLEDVRNAYPQLSLCVQSGTVYATAAMQAAAGRAQKSAGALGMLLGKCLLGSGALCLVMGVPICVLSGAGMFVAASVLFPALLMIIPGVICVEKARKAGARAAWLRTSGLSLEARIVEASFTGMQVNDVPVFNLSVQVMGPQGPYASAFKLRLREHEVAAYLNRIVRVRANPQNLGEIILET